MVAVLIGALAAIPVSVRLPDEVSDCVWVAVVVAGPVDCVDESVVLTG